MDKKPRYVEDILWQADAPVWEVVPLTGYILPGFVGLGSAVKKWTSLQRTFRRSTETSLTPARSEGDLRALPQVRLENLAPPINWALATRALDTVLQDWLRDEHPEPSVRFFIGQPWCDHAAILQQWARIHGAELIAPPDPGQVLQSDVRWVQQWQQHDRLWVMPRLERCYLRHADGLGLVRDFLERAASGSLGRGIIGCDSWAWAYLQRVWPLAQPDVLTLQAFDGEKMTRLFACLAEMNASEQVQFCNAKTGNPVLPGCEDIVQGTYTVSRELKQLAAHCRGNPGTAWSYWRHRLRSEPDADGSLSVSEDSNEKKGSESVVWLAAELVEPAMPMEADDDMAFVLHGLLLHNGLSAETLAEILPLSRSRIMSLLLRLLSCGLVNRDETSWQVSALGYATVREFLRARDYLTDQF
jgi:hypothetical protein